MQIAPDRITWIPLKSPDLCRLESTYQPICRGTVQQASREGLHTQLLVQSVEKSLVKTRCLSNAHKVWQGTPPPPLRQPGAGGIIDTSDWCTLCRLKQRLATEDAKHAMWHAENARRKHNYFPFVFNLLRILGEENHLQSLIKIAETKPKPEDRDDS